MPLIQKQKREVKRPITIKLEQGLAERLTCYARFLESSRDHVIAGIVQYVMDRDRDFAAWMTTESAGSGAAVTGIQKQPETAVKAAG